MPQNRVLFQLGPWPVSWAAVCLALGVCLLAITVGLIVILAIRQGRTRRLAGLEASRVAYDADQLGAESATIHGPATGVEARVSFTIGDLRRARLAGDSLLFWGGPAMMMACSGSFSLMSLAAALWMGEIAMLSGLLVLVPMFLIACFMPWAAVHTKLE